MSDCIYFYLKAALDIHLRYEWTLTQKVTIYYDLANTTFVPTGNSFWHHDVNKDDVLAKTIDKYKKDKNEYAPRDLDAKRKRCAAIQFTQYANVFCQSNIPLNL